MRFVTDKFVMFCCSGIYIFIKFILITLLLKCNLIGFFKFIKNSVCKCEFKIEAGPCIVSVCHLPFVRQTLNLILYGAVSIIKCYVGTLCLSINVKKNLLFATVRTY